MQLSIEIKNTKNKAFSNPRFYGETGGTMKPYAFAEGQEDSNPRFYGETGGTEVTSGPFNGLKYTAIPDFMGRPAEPG